MYIVHRRGLPQKDHCLCTIGNEDDNGFVVLNVQWYRTDTPGFGFVVLNRLNSGNVLQYVHPGMEFIIKDNFVMYKSSSEYSIQAV